MKAVRIPHEASLWAIVVGDPDHPVFAASERVDELYGDECAGEGSSVVPCWVGKL
jgi:hypothetical protein